MSLKHKLIKLIETIKLYNRSFCRCYFLCFSISMYKISIPETSKNDQMKYLLQGKVDILVFTESKMDLSVPTNQFVIQGYSNPFRFDRDRNRGGILLYISEDILIKELKQHRHPHEIEGIFVELNLRNTK